MVDHTLGVEKTQSHQVEPLLALAETNLAAQRWTDAATNASRASTLARSIHGESSCRLAAPLRTHAEALLGASDTAAALPLAEKALSLAEGAQVDPLARARAQFTVARALPSLDRDRGRQLATSARETATKDTRDPNLLKRIDAWLAGAAP